jgi:hypothetical protein
MKLLTLASLGLALSLSLSAEIELDKKDLGSEILQAIESAATCDACEVSYVVEFE